jgi:hypothetical protein
MAARLGEANIKTMSTAAWSPALRRWSSQVLLTWARRPQFWNKPRGPWLGRSKCREFQTDSGIISQMKAR